MGKKIVLAASSLVLLTLLLAVSVFVALQRQDIRPKAGRESEFMVLSEAGLRKGGRAQTAVTLSQLDPNLEYRLAFELTYEENPDNPPDSDKPEELKKTKRVSENKTYTFSFPFPTCKWKARLNAKLYYREAGGEWREIQGDQTNKTIELTVPCVIERREIQPPQPPDIDIGTDSAALSPLPVSIEEILKNLPDDETLERIADAAEALGGLEDLSTLIRESEEAASRIPTPDPTPEPTPKPSPVASPLATPKPTELPQTPAPTSAIVVSPTPTAQSLISPTPTLTTTLPGASPSPSAGQTQPPTLTPSATPVTTAQTTETETSPTTTGFGTLLTQSPTITQPTTPITADSSAQLTEPQSDEPSLPPATAAPTQTLASPQASSITTQTSLPSPQVRPTSTTSRITQELTPPTPPATTTPAGESILPLILLGGAAAILTGVGIVLLF